MMHSSVPTDIGQDHVPEDGDPTYFYKPNLVGSPWVFCLRPKGLAWEYGRRSGFVGYDQMRRIRMSFRPGTLQMQRYITEIWAPDNPKLQIASVSFRGLMEQARQDADYNAFIAELHRRLASAGSTARFESGTHPAVYWMGVAVFAAIGVTLAIFLVHTLSKADWTGVLMLLGVLALLAWQVGTILYRNRPLVYRPEAPPTLAMPPS